MMTNAIPLRSCQHCSAPTIGAPLCCDCQMDLARGYRLRRRHARRDHLLIAVTVFAAGVLAGAIYAMAVG